MRLASLLAEMPSDQLERLAAEHLGNDENVSRATLCTTLEGVLRSYSFVRRFIADRLPPTFSILELLLEADGWSLPATHFRDAVTERTALLSDRITKGELIGRDSSLKLFRRVLVEARRNGLELDASESALIGVLRRELGIRATEQYLVEHHPDFFEFWNLESSFLHEMNALRSAGLVFGYDGAVLLAEEVVPLVRQALGFEMPTASRRRLYEQFSGADLAEVLGKCELRTSGSRDEKLQRLLASYVQPTESLRILSLQTLRDLCRDAKASVSGSKDELVERLVHRYLYNLDQATATEPPPPPPPEPKRLEEQRFRALFSAMKGDELTDVLTGIQSSRVTGAKDAKVTLLFTSPYCETTLLDQLTNKCLEEFLARNRLKTAGSKRDRVDRIVDYFATMPAHLLVSVAHPQSPTADTDVDATAEQQTPN